MLIGEAAEICRATSEGALRFQELSHTSTGASCFLKHLAHLLHNKQQFNLQAVTPTGSCPQARVVLQALKKSWTFLRNANKSAVICEETGPEEKHLGLAPKGWEYFALREVSAEYIFKANKCVLFKFSVTVGGIKRTDCKWVMFVMLPIGGGREGKREGLDLLGRGLGWARSGQGKGLLKRCVCFWKLTYPPWYFRNNLEISTENLYPAFLVSFSWTILAA